jgi:hypothetical protein
MIARVIEWCAHNRFLVFTGVLLLTLTGIWSMGHMSWDRALRIFKRWLPAPRVLHPYPVVRFLATHPRWEPYA